VSVAVRDEQVARPEAFRAPYGGQPVKVMVTYSGPQSAESVIDELRRAGIPAEAEVLFAVPHTMVPVSSSMRRPSLFPRTWSLRTEALPGIRLVGDEATEIAESWGADLILVGSKSNRNVDPAYFACISPGVAARAHCSVRVARSRTLGGGIAPRLLVGVDGSRDADEAVREVARRMWPRRTTAVVVTVEERGPEGAAAATPSRQGAFSAAGGARLADARVRVAESADLLRAAGLEVSTEIRHGDPVDELEAAARAWNAECVVIGSHGLRHSRGGGTPGAGLGAVADALARRAPFSIEIVRGRPALAARAAFPGGS
jgi:nucleotide-binding universal stress UspA family protein